ncbi:MAG: GrpB family protein [Spirosomaceae bacterium]|nr:GrpB family protein [Spirosomataceae bacterium]
MQILIEEYNPEWVIQFEKIKEKLAKALLGINVEIEHIGSTSIQNLAAKPIIDVDIVYFDNSDFGDIKKGLESLGYFHNGNQGIEGREVFKRTGNDEILDRITHHLYVCKADSEELRRHIAFRNYLQKHEVARSFYQSLKYKIAEEANQNKKLYAEMKELKAKSFIDYIIEVSSIYR